MSRKFTGESWAVTDIEDFWIEIDKIGKEFNIDYPDTQIEILSSDQMVETIAMIGAPCSYDHWSIGKESIELKNSYKRGRTGLALELIINSDPTIMYIMENNTLIQQGLVLAHAGVGHGSVFKNNYLFKQWTSPDSILDYLKFARDYIKQCEMEHGPDIVESMIDVCRALDDYAVSHKKRKRLKHYRKLIKELGIEKQSAENTVLNRKYKKHLSERIKAIEKSIERDKFIELPEENVLYFIEKYSPILDSWQREIIRIHRKIAEYFYPQRKTKIVHEGWASFIQMRIFEKLYENQTITEGGFLEFLRNHVNVCYQPDYDSKYYSGTLNPYAIGYYIFNDLYRMTHSPKKEDFINYPEICNTDWTKSLMDIVCNYSDVDFISRYLTPNTVKYFKLFSIMLDMSLSEGEIKGISNDIEVIRDNLASSLDTFNHCPRLEVTGLGVAGRLILDAYSPKGLSVDLESLDAIEGYIRYLWGSGAVIHDKSEM